MTTRNNTVLLFSKVPETGLVKTRLSILKDGMFPANPEDRTVDMRPLGEGQLDIPAIAANMPDRISQIIVELDRSNIDMTESVRRSHDYLVRCGVGC